MEQMLLKLSCCVLVAIITTGALSPPFCYCHFRKMLMKSKACPLLSNQRCEKAYDFCHCCPKCALSEGKRCQIFGLPCKSGLVCLWERFWYETPLAGTCIQDIRGRTESPGNNQYFWKFIG